MGKNWKVYAPLAFIILCVVAGAAYWYYDYSHYLKTEDAYIASDNIPVSSKIIGRIASVYKDEGDSVKKGELVAECDSTDLLAQKAQTIANRTQAESAKFQSVAKYNYDLKNIKVQKIALDRAHDDYNRAKIQYDGGVITKEQFDHAGSALESAEAQYEAANALVEVSKTQIRGAESAVGTASAQIAVIAAQLENMKLYAPSDGLVAKRWLLPGDVVQPGQSVFTVNNNSKYWVIAYLEETKIGKVRMGQPAKFSIDAFPGVTFSGKVFLIGSNTASQFSLIPQNNASGNFTKVTQRIPVKISIDSADGGKTPASFNMMSGMSVVLKIVRD
jgi:membrane fusion protein (multidrug efflux system)